MSSASTRVLALRTLLATVYGETPVVSATNGVLPRKCEVKFKSETVQRQVVKGYMGAAEAIPVNERFDISIELELSSSGTQGTAPPCGEFMIASGFAETAVPSGNAALTQTSPATVVGTATGTFTYTKTAAPVLTLPRTVTLACTTGGASGVAAFTVSAPATPLHTAYSATGQVMTDATPFALCNSCTITPTVGTAFVIGDTFTIKLMPPHVYYTPVSDSFGSNGGMMHFSRRNHIFKGARYNCKIAVDAKAIPYLSFDGMALYHGIAEELTVPTTTLTRWKKPVPVNEANTAMPLLHGYSAPMYAFSFDQGAKVNDINLPGQHEIAITDRAADNCSITIQDPKISDWDYFAAVRDVVLGGFSFIHGTAPGAIVEFQATAAQVSDPTTTDKDGAVAAQFKLGLIPTNAGNDELKILFY